MLPARTGGTSSQLPSAAAAGPAAGPPALLCSYILHGRAPAAALAAGTSVATPKVSVLTKASTRTAEPYGTRTGSRYQSPAKQAVNSASSSLPSSVG